MTSRGAPRLGLPAKLAWVACHHRRGDRVSDDVCFWHKADVQALQNNVRYRGQSKRDAEIAGRPLLTLSEHSSCPRNRAPRSHTLSRGRRLLRPNDTVKLETV